MVRGYGRAPRGERCVGAVPHGPWQTTTFVGALRQRALVAPMVAEGPMDGEMFRVYVNHCLLPVLRSGDLVILDNLSSHKVRGVREAITAAGATVVYLPPYSPDLNPIEQAFAKIKHWMRTAQMRTIEDTWRYLGSLIETIQPGECGNYFVNAGYASDKK